MRISPDTFESGGAGLLGGAAGLLGADGGFGGPGELGRGQHLPPVRHHEPLGGQAVGQRFSGQLGLLLAQQVQDLLEGFGRLGGADVREQLGLIAQGGGETGAVGGVIDVEFDGEFGDHRLDLDAQLGPAALDPQRQRMIDVIGHADDLAGRPVRPVPAPHLRHRPAQAQRGQHVVGIVYAVALSLVWQ